MKSLKFTFASIILFFYSQELFSQLDSIYDQGAYRTFIVHTPAGYNAINQYPLVINLHGLNSNAAEQEAYSQFDNVADTENFIVVYPNAIGSSWPINGTSGDDAVNFISHLIDSIRTDYSCNSCLFITGMSNGGFFTYYLACKLPQSQSINAIAVVSGNMQQVLENTCVIANGLPVMHFHGTSDNIVNYNGTIGIPPVETTIQWWVNQNNCSTTPIITAIPNINTGDSCTVEKYYYGNGTNGSEVTFYKIDSGGHTWPGAIPIPLFGNTNQDINASTLMGTFFSGFCSVSTSIGEQTNNERISVFPNPANKQITIHFPKNEQQINLIIYDTMGQEVFNQRLKNNLPLTSIDISQFTTGIYFVRATTQGHTVYNQKIIITK